jgi:hypothetical protein
VPEYKVYVISLLALNGVVVRARSAIEAIVQSTTIVRDVVVNGVVPNEFVSTSDRVQVPMCALVILLSYILFPLLPSVVLGVKVINAGRL